MTLRRKTFLIIGMTLVILVAVLYAISSLILMGGFVNVEKQDTQQNVKRALAALSDELANLGRMNRDYAAWDDTYTFIEDANDTYIKTNLVDATFSNLKLNLMVFVDASGRVVFGKAFDLENGVEAPFPESLYQHLSASSPLLQHSDPDSDLTGIVLLPEGPMLVSSRPIVTSEYRGPIRGTLIFGRYLDSAAIEQLAMTTQLSLTVRRLDDLQLPPDFQAVRASFSEETPILTRPLNVQTIAGYTLLTDIYKQPALLLRVDLPRAIYQQGQASMRYFFISLLVVSLAIGAGGLWLAETFVLSRLARLSTEVSSIGTSGDHSARILMTGKDELTSLADAINRMLAAVERSRLERQESEALRESENRLRRHATQLQAVAEVSRIATTLLDPDQLIAQTVESIQERFGFYYVGLFLLDADNRFAVLQQGSGEAGRMMRERGHRLEVGGQSMVGWACANKQARIALDVGQEAVRFANPLLPDTHSEMALPLRAGERVLGALDVQSTQVAAFDESDIAALQSMADQVAVALDNARLFAESQAALEAARHAYGELSRQAWVELLRGRADWGYRYTRRSIAPAEGDWRPEMLQAANMGQIVQVDGPGEPALAIPLKVRDQVVGVLRFRKGTTDETWTAEEMALLETLVDQLGLALESARLYRDTQRRAARERLAGEIATRIRAAGDIDGILRTTVQEIRHVLGASHGVIRLGTETQLRPPGGNQQAAEGGK